jgi:photosystem II stability/assembly factor-like uncharacterized protein
MQLPRLLIIPFLLLPWQPVRSQWIQTNGPEGGYIRALVFMNNTVFATSSGRPADVYMSTDGGLSWTRRSSVPLETAQRAFPDGSRLFLMGRFGVFLSTDAGITWSDRSAGSATTTQGLSMARLGDRLFLGCQDDGDPGIFPFGALYQSSDLGASWERVSLPFVDNDIAVNSILAVDTILVVSGQRAIYRSSTRGQSWSVFSGGTWGGDFIFHKGYVFASASLRSSDSGATWDTLTGNVDKAPTVERFSQSGPMLYALDYRNGPFRSSDAGVHWENLTDGLYLPFCFRPLVSKDSLVLVSNYNYGVFRSTNCGATWKEANHGIIATSIGSLYAENNTLLAGTVFPSSTWGSLFRSTDQGMAWRLTDSVGHPSRNCFLRVNDRLFAGASQGAEWSSDDGSTWRAAGIGLPVEAFQALTAVNDTIYAGSKSGSGVYRSTDYGTTWSGVSNGLPASSQVNALVVVSGSDGEAKSMFCGSDKGVYRSVDGGGKWSAVNPGLTSTYVYALAVAPASTEPGMMLFAGTRDGVFRTTDSGGSWVSANVGIVGSRVRKLLACPPGVGSDMVLLAVTDTGVFRSSNHGQNWVSISEGLEGVTVMAIAANSSDVFVGTVHGVWKRPLTEILTSVSPGNTTAPPQLSLQQNYPNPFNPSTVITYELPRAGHVTLRVHDVLGREVVRLVNGQRNAGQHEVTFDASHLSSGVYLYQLRAGDYVSVKKMLLVR